MNAESLRKLVIDLPEHGFYSRRLGDLLKAGKSEKFSPTGNNHSQKVHWLRWLDDYEKPGFYKRQILSGVEARSIYNRVQNSSMALYLPEALGLPKKLIKEAFEAALNADALSMSKQCAAIRKTIPWEIVQEAIEARE